MQEVGKSSNAINLGSRAFCGLEVGPYLLIAPALITLGLFVFAPLVQTVFISFFEWNLVNPKREFVGLENYAAILRDPAFPGML